MSQAKVTITDIAKRAGVSKTTVSRVLNDKPDVDKETREQVLAIIRETGFVPQTQAVNLVKGRTGLIGLLVPSLTNPYSLTVIQGVAEALAETDYEMILYTTSMASKNQELFVKRLTRNLTDGLLILLPRNFREYEDRLIKSQFPVVLIDHRGLSSDFPSITASNRKGSRGGGPLSHRSGARAHRVRLRADGFRLQQGTSGGLPRRPFRGRNPL
jgi:LacI family transcriptional regulator